MLGDFKHNYKWQLLKMKIVTRIIKSWSCKSSNIFQVHSHILILVPNFANIRCSDMIAFLALKCYRTLSSITEQAFWSLPFNEVLFMMQGSYCNC